MYFMGRNPCDSKQDLISRGNFARVYKTDDALLKQQVAL